LRGPLLNFERFSGFSPSRLLDLVFGEGHPGHFGFGVGGARVTSHTQNGAGSPDSPIYDYLLVCTYIPQTQPFGLDVFLNSTSPVLQTQGERWVITTPRSMLDSHTFRRCCASLQALDLESSGPALAPVLFVSTAYFQPLPAS
jgi:hypothetical protein